MFEHLRSLRVAENTRNVPESNTRAKQYNVWRTEPAHKYASGVYRKGERV